ncbi:MAG: 50S ribosomal protein L24 [Planctomycetes bacterium]|nr:50S ribosomal protein L24 [Planctomycetota bacterium]
MHVKRNDNVEVIAGNHKGKRGRVKVVVNSKDRVIIAGINIRKKHVKPTREHPQGGRIDIEAPLAVSNVLPYCEKCEKPRRMIVKKCEEDSKIRACVKCGTDFGEKY